jgi:hypothetical protein
VILFVFLFRLTSLDFLENGIAINFERREFGLATFNHRTHPSAPIATAAKQTAASNQDIFLKILKKLL